MFFKKHEKRGLSPLCVIIVGGLATVGAMSIVGACREMVCDKAQTIVSMFKRGASKKCSCNEVEQA